MSVGGRYSFVRPISRGHCSVFEARDEQQGGEVVAVKVTKKSDIWNMNYFDGLYREYLVLRTKLQHPNVVRCREVLHGQRCLYHILDYAGDMNLEQLIESRAPARCLEPREADNGFLQIGEGLWHCHQRRLSHRSISPHHVVVDRSSQPQGVFRYTLVDFRSALSANDGQMGQMQHGKMPYMAPEMMAGSPHHPLSVDCWSIGAVLADMAASREVLCEAIQWDGQAEPGEEAAQRARESLRRPGLLNKLALRRAAKLALPPPTQRAIRAVEALLNPIPRERQDLSAVLEAFRTAGQATANAEGNSATPAKQITASHTGAV